MFGILAGIGSDIGWGAGDFFAAVSSRKIGNLLTFFWMQATGVILASFYFVLTYDQTKLLALGRFLPRLGAVAFFIVLAYIAFYRGLEKAQVSLVSPIGGCWGVVTSILSVIFYHDILRPGQAVAIAVILCGILLLSADWKTLLTSKKTVIFAGVSEGMIAMLGWGIGLFLVVPVSRSLGWFLPTISYRALGFVMLFLYLLLIKRPMVFPKARSAQIPLLLVGALDILGHFSYNLGVSGAYAAVVAPVASAFPVVTILLAVLFLKERLRPYQVAGITAIISGLIVMSL
ncbi:DMT family transporter [Patescibacteria group bacterium]|nr:DMT family transporter [Patescibacteria group bacterium]